jgi:hypothetical protein
MASLSVVVTILAIEEGHTSRCLAALFAQKDAPPMEIIVPIYPSLDGKALDGKAGLREAWPDARFVEMPDDPPPAGTGLEHWKYDRRRAAGLAFARGNVIAMTEDRAIPDERWCAMIWAEHRRLDYEVIGGGIAFAGSGLFSRAVFYCDFGRYEPPFRPGVVDYVSAANVSYKRAALDNCKDSWEQFYDESEVHRRIHRAGGRLYLTPGPAVRYDRGSFRALVALRQKRASGRVFAGRRAHAATEKRFTYAAFCPALAPLMLLRMYLSRKQRGQPMGPFRAAAPFVFLCLLFWSLGEFIGYVTAQPFPHRRSGA